MKQYPYPNQAVRLWLLTTKSWLTLKSSGFLLLCCVLIGGLTAQDVRLGELFTDHAVLQRGVDHPFWGWAPPKTRLSVDFQGASYRTQTDETGRWQIMLPPQAAGGPYQITVKAKGETHSLEDIYFGDVYLLSGQSNMEWRLRQSDVDGSRAQTIADPLIREITVAKSVAGSPVEHLKLSAAWRPGTAEHIAEFSAVGSYFAHYLRASVDVPIGLLHSSWGGSRIEAWMPAGLLGLDENISLIEEGLDNPRVQAALAKYKADFGQATPPSKDEGEALGYLGFDVDFTTWPKMPVPGLWESHGYQAVNGHFYFVKYFELSEEQAAVDATLFLGPVDDSDWTYVNGLMVGETYAAYAEDRVYTVPQEALHAGINFMLVRVEDTGGGGGMYAAPEKMKLATVAGDIALAGDWYYQIGSFAADVQHNQTPTILYNKMIHPLAKLPLTGILWYQGESNAGPDDAVAYEKQFQDMITNWRSHFDNPDLPFYWVQLANFLAPQESPDEVGWATLRNSQTAALALPNTGQAVITDIGEADDIHPRNKWEVGRRLALHALQNIYAQTDLPAESPRLGTANARSGMVLLKFEHTGGGLIARDDRYGYARGFVYQNQNGEWKWAKAVLEPQGTEAMLLLEKGETAQEVRYGWANNPDGNVFSLEGLPLTPFSIKFTE